MAAEKQDEAKDRKKSSRYVRNERLTLNLDRDEIMERPMSLGSRVASSTAEGL